MAILNEGGGSFLKWEEVKEGDIVTFLDEGRWVESKYKYDDGNAKNEFVMKVKYNNEEYNVRVGKYSRDELIPAYSNDTATWLGKNAKIHIENYRSLNKKGIILSPTEEGLAVVAQTKEEVKPSDVKWDE